MLQLARGDWYRQRQPVLFRHHAGLGQRAAQGRKADRNLESLGGADQVRIVERIANMARTSKEAQTYLEELLK